MEILAVSDRDTFSKLMANMGLPVVGVQNVDPLRSQIQEASIAAIASYLTEDANDRVRVSPKQLPYLQLAESYGYLISVEPTR